jgi:electron transport complex protein RnfG
VKKFIDESWLVLAMGVVFAFLLAGTQGALRARIEQNEQQELQDAIKAVVPGTIEIDKLAEPVEGHDVYKCSDADGQMLGWAVRGEGSGFVDKIGLVAGLDPSLEQTTGIKVIVSSETPGLGSKITDEGQDAWPNEYDGLDTNREINVVKRKPVAGANEVQAITGATYSSEYVTDIVNTIIKRVRPKLVEESSATMPSAEPVENQE